MMSIYSLLVAIFVASASAGEYIGKSICVGYAECVEMHFTVKDDAVNCGGDCTVQACMKRASCWKDGGLSHVCSSAADCASSPNEGPDALTEKKLDFKDDKDEGFLVGETLCATGKSGEYVHFAIKDALYTCDGHGQEVSFKAGEKGNCYRWSSDYGKCSGDGENNIKATCAYSVQLPDICGSHDDSGRGNCCMSMSDPTCAASYDNDPKYADHMSIDIPIADIKDLAKDPRFTEYGCTVTDDDCSVMVCTKHVPESVVAELGGSPSC